MRKETFLKLLSDIDDDLIDEAEKPRKKKYKNIMKYLSTAACICIVLGGSLIGSFIKCSEEKTVKTSPISDTQKIAEADKTYAIDNDECKTNDKGSENKDSVSSQNKKTQAKAEMNDEINLYNGEGTGEFVFNKKLYYIVNNTDYLMSNSLPTQIGASDVGSNLANNVYDTANNNIGNVYEYKNMNNQEMLIVEDMNGIYNLAVEK